MKHGPGIVTLSDHPFNWFLRLLIGGAFVIAGILKIGAPADFALDVSHYRLVPHALLNPVAIVLPWIELVAGACVITGFRLRAGALLIAAMTAVFFFVILSALARGLNIECGCFGTIAGKTIGLQTLAVDFGCFCLAILLIRRTGNRPAPLRRSGP